MTSYPFLRWRPRPLNTTSGFIFVDVTAFRMSKSTSKPNFVENRRLRYNYFRFWKTNFCHIGILLPVSTSTISSWSACYSASCCRISSKSQHPLPKHEVISIFQMAAASHVICFGVMADHPRGLNSIRKQLVRRINSSGDIAIYRLWRFGLKLPIHARFGAYFLHMTSLIVLTPERTVLGRKHRHLSHSA